MASTFCTCGGIKGSCGCKARLTTKERGYDNQWRTLSERYRAENPLCEDCFRDGKTTPCTEVHHIVAISVDSSRRMDKNNLVALCTACHEKRHSVEYALHGMPWTKQNVLIAADYAEECGEEEDAKYLRSIGLG